LKGQIFKTHFIVLFLARGSRNHREEKFGPKYYYNYYYESTSFTRENKNRGRTHVGLVTRP